MLSDFQNSFTDRPTSNTHTHTHTHVHPFNGPFSRTTRVSRYQKGKTTVTPAPHHSVFLQAKWWGTGVVICLELGADLHMAQLMPLPLTVSCFSKIQIGFDLSDRPTGKFVTNSCLNTPPHLKYVATLPCEI